MRKETDEIRYDEEMCYERLVKQRRREQKRKITFR